jgi:putative membrane protein
MSEHTRDFFLWLHIMGFILWVGPLGGAARLLLIAQAEQEGNWSTRIAGIARKIAMVADIGATFAILAGVYMLTQESEILKQPFMHVKLTLVVALLGLHGFVRVKAKRMAQAKASFSPAILAAIFLVAAGIVFAIIFKLPHRS